MPQKGNGRFQIYLPGSLVKSPKKQEILQAFFSLHGLYVNYHSRVGPEGRSAIDVEEGLEAVVGGFREESDRVHEYRGGRKACRGIMRLESESRIAGQAGGAVREWKRRRRVGRPCQLDCLSMSARENEDTKKQKMVILHDHRSTSQESRDMQT